MPLKHKILIATASTFLVAASLALAPLAEAKTTLPAPYVSRSVFKSSLLVDSIPWQIITVKNGDSVEKIFKDSGVDLRQLQEILTLNKATNTALNHIKPGQTMALQTTPQHKLLQLKYALGDDRTLWVQRASEGFKTIIKQTALNKPRVDNGIHYVSGTIHHSLTEAAQEAGMGRGMSNQLANIFGPRIDFKRLQPGDHFNLIYQGQSLNNATILAAEFNNRGNAYQAVRYTDSLGHSEYYDPKGQNFQATTGLLRYPVAFSRISSYFSYKRYDPVLHRVHSHPGLDLAAPRGTPIKSIGEGRVDFVGRRGGYGNAVVVSYGRNYSALFGHMSRFSSGLRRNSTVHQGQVIGYVGSTGFATGPHVHFEVHVNGVPRDPLKVTPPPARSIDTKDRLRFLQQAKSLMAELQLYQRTELAANASGDRKIN